MRKQFGTNRPTVKRETWASLGMVTSNHPLASLAGVEMLLRGGNAVDAAVATLFALSVVEPMMVSIFGAGFFTVRLADGRVMTVDDYAVVPLAAREDMYVPIPGSLDNDVEGGLNDTGYLAVATPGSLLGWVRILERAGRLPLAVVVEPAVRYARNGFRISPYLHGFIRLCQDALARFPASAELFLPGGKPAPVGSVLRLPDYATTLERIGAQGAAYLYDGPLGQVVAAEMAANGGLVTLDDLARYRVYEREPVRGSYRGYEIVSMGPVSSGGILLIEMLNILEGFDLPAFGFGTPDTVHLIAEVMKIAFADRGRYLADPERVRIPVEWLTSTAYAAERRAQIDLRRAQPYTPGMMPDGEGTCTTHCCAADADGNVVSATQTLNGAFGSKVTVPRTGMLLNNCMKLMDPTPGHPNSIAPGKRILSSMSPTIVLRDGEPLLAIGTPGGVRIFGAVLQAIVNVIDFGMSVQEAVEAPRLFNRGPVLELERGFDRLPELVAELEQRGHTVQLVPKVAGGMNGILIDQETGLLRGGACWRADGAAVGYSGGEALTTDEEFSPGIPV